MTLTHRRPTSEIRYDWFTYVPPTLAPTELSTVWVSGLHGNNVTDRYAEIVDETRDLLDRFAVLARADQLRTPLLVPVFPRPFTPDRQSSFYSVALPRAVFLDTTPPFCRRPDLTLNQMIDQFVHELRGLGYTIRDTILIDGFSAGGMFAQRYALLHPTRVLALAAGQCGGALTVPDRQYGVTALNWPVGVADFDRLTGTPFERDRYQRIAQYIYIGDEDSANSTLGDPGEVPDEPSEVWNSLEEIRFLNETFGGSDPLRLRNQVASLQGKGYQRITFHGRPGVDHSERPFVADILTFFRRAMQPDLST